MRHESSPPRPPPRHVLEQRAEQHEVEDRLGEAEDDPHGVAQEDAHLALEDEEGLGGHGRLLGVRGLGRSASSPSRSERPVSVRKTSSSDGRWTDTDAGCRPAASSGAQQRGDGDRALVDGDVRGAPSTAVSSRVGDRLADDRPRRRSSSPASSSSSWITSPDDARLQRRRRVVGDEPAAVHDEDPVGERVGLLQVVRREQDGHARVLAQGPDVPPQVRAALRVQAGGRLVEEHERRGVHEPEGDVEAAALAAGELEQRAALQPAEVQPRRQLGERGARRRPCERPCSRACVIELLADPRAGGGGGADLGDVADAAPQLARLGGEVVPGDGRRARRSARAAW